MAYNLKSAMLHRQFTCTKGTNLACEHYAWTLRAGDIEGPKNILWLRRILSKHLSVFALQPQVFCCGLLLPTI